MPITPLGRRPTQRSGLSPEEDAARLAEKDAQRRIASAEQEVETARKSADQRIDEIRDRYEKREVGETDRLAEAFERRKAKGYEELRDLQRAQQADLNRTRREGERQLGKLENHYRDTARSVEHRGEENLRHMQSQQALSLEHERRARDAELELNREQSRHQIEESNARREAGVQALQEAGRKEYERIQANASTATREAEEAFRQKFEARVSDQETTLSEIQARAARELTAVRKDTSHRLAAYADRQRDPFYKLLDLEANLSDEGDHFLLTATIPEHEQGHVSVSIKGNQLVLTGARRNEERLELEPGHTVGTNSFQSFLETFPIDWPVDAKSLSREFSGDRLVVRVPKKGSRDYQSPIKPTPARARAERPKFPENIPIAKAEAGRIKPEDPEPSPLPDPSKNRRKGWRTLT